MKSQINIIREANEPYVKAQGLLEFLSAAYGIKTGQIKFIDQAGIVNA